MMHCSCLVCDLSEVAAILYTTASQPAGRTWSRAATLHTHRFWVLQSGALPSSHPCFPPSHQSHVSQFIRPHQHRRFLLIYYVGVLKVLQQLGIVQPGKPAPLVAGISSGAITAGAICSGVPEERLYETVTDLFRTCRRSPCAGGMDKTVRELLDRSLPPDAAEKCQGRLFAGVTVLDNKMPRSIIASVMDGINNRADMIATLAASAYIPIWSGRRCV